MELDNVKKWIVVAGGAFIVALAAALWYLRSDEEMPAQNPAPETARARDKGTAKRGRKTKKGRTTPASKKTKVLRTRSPRRRRNRQKRP